jgi:undecaprenyl-diphosphatase
MSKNALASSADPQPARRLLSFLLPGIALVLCVALIITGAAGGDWWQVVILGIVEGITEFLPISSTGHLLIAADLLDFQHSIGGTFEIFIQLGAVLAVIGYYARDLLAQARSLPASPRTRRFWLCILVAFLPAAVIGLALRDVIKTVLCCRAGPW